MALVTSLPLGAMFLLVPEQAVFWTSDLLNFPLRVDWLTRMHLYSLSLSIRYKTLAKLCTLDCSLPWQKEISHWVAPLNDCTAEPSGATSSPSVKTPAQLEYSAGCLT
ncbi:hypothetical protein C8J57DRAFT_1364765 [Mycena rebaudengoi]|nr:hypothetical protein C8J57DRAFT_1364765 [Mycena rebaudengoi]